MNNQPTHRQEYETLIKLYVSSQRNRFFSKCKLSDENLFTKYLNKFDKEKHFDSYNGEITLKKYCLIRVKAQLIYEKKGKREEYINTLKNNPERLLELITVFVTKDRVRFNPHADISNQDIIYDILLKWEQNGYISKFNGAITSPEYFIKVGVRNFLIDRERKVKLTTLSGDLPCKSDTCDSQTKIFDMIDVKACDIYQNYLIEEDTILIEELFTRLKKEKSWGSFGQSALLGTVQLSHYTVMCHYIKGYSDREIGEIFTLSKQRVSGIRSEAIKLMRSYV